MIAICVSLIVTTLVLLLDIRDIVNDSLYSIVCRNLLIMGLIFDNLLSAVINIISVGLFTIIILYPIARWDSIKLLFPTSIGAVLYLSALSVTSLI